MKKYGSLIALVVVVVLAVVFFATRDKPVTTVKAPYSIAKVQNLKRIELTRPGDELVVLEKPREEWMLTKPVEAPVAPRIAEQIDEAFADSIGTDDLTVSTDALADYELDDAKAVNVALYPAGASSPASEFQIGKGLSVEGTRAKRTFIKTPEGKVFRAHTDLGDWLRKPVAELRSKEVVAMPRESIKVVTVTRADGSKVELKKDDDTGWVLTEPRSNFALEKGQVTALVSNLSRLSAVGFVDEPNLAELGLDPPVHELLIKADKGYRLLVSDERDGKFYAKLYSKPHVYELPALTGNAITPTALSLRSRLVNDVDKEKVTRLEFAGSDRVVVEKADGAWKFVRPNRGAAVKPTAIDPLVNTFAQLRAVRFDGDVELAEAGLKKPAATLTMVADGKEHVLLIGGQADPKGNLWAKWKDRDVVMVVSGWVKDRAETTADKLEEEAS